MSKTLVVIDMQNDFTSGALGNAECLAAVDKVAEVVKNGSYDRIIVTRDTHTPNYMETNEGRHLPVVHCVEDTDGWNLHETVAKAIVEKGLPTTYFNKGTFGCLSMANYMTEEFANSSETEFDFCGVCTGICVISNVMLTKAALPEASIRVLSDACACVTPDTHKTALDAMKLCHIEII